MLIATLYPPPPTKRHALTPEVSRTVLLLFVAITSGLLCASTARAQDGPKSHPRQVTRQLDSYTAAPAQVFTATAYSLRGRTASGVSVSRGLLAADRRVLPLGTRVRIEAGSYSGEYVVADTGGEVRGRKIDIWVPNSDEVMRFGRRPIKLTILNKTPVFLRKDLEEQYVRKHITYEEYKTKDREVTQYEDEFYKEAALENIRYERSLTNATYSPIKFSADPANEKGLLDTYYERLRLEVDLARKVLSKAEYNERLKSIVTEEKEIARSGVHTPTEIADYYEATSHIQPTVALLQQATGGQQASSSEPLLKWGTLFVALLGATLTFYLGHGKDKREKRLLELEKRRVELAEVNALETVEKTKLLLQTRELQVEEMKLKLVQMEEQVLATRRKLIIT
jgi:3D (Asp-Asp-Asp) domain-containing protein